MILMEQQIIIFGSLKGTLKKYSKAWSKGSTTASVGVSINDYPKYQSITADDIYVITTSLGAHYSGDGTVRNADAGVSWTYNATNGIVTISSVGSNVGCTIGATGGYIYIFN